MNGGRDTSAPNLPGQAVQPAKIFQYSQANKYLKASPAHAIRESKNPVPRIQKIGSPVSAGDVHRSASIHHAARVHPAAYVGARARVAAFAVVERRASIGADSKVGVGAYIGPAAKVPERTVVPAWGHFGTFSLFRGR